MKYTVEVTAFAQADIDLAYGWLAVRTVHADVWLNGLQTQIEALSAFPTRCPLAPESREFREPVRQMLYGNSPNVHRVLFIVRKTVVYVVHVRHGARDAVMPEDIDFPPESATD